MTFFCGGESTQKGGDAPVKKKKKKGEASAEETIDLVLLLNPWEKGELKKKGSRGHVLRIQEESSR